MLTRIRLLAQNHDFGAGRYCGKHMSLLSCRGVTAHAICTGLATVIHTTLRSAVVT